MIVVHIDGPEGSGKSSTANEIKKINGVKVYDLDDIDAHCFRTIRKQMPISNKNFYKHMSKCYVSAVKDIVDRNQNNVIVFAGSRWLPVKIDHKFAVKLGNLKESYLIRIRRDVENITKYDRDLHKMFKEEDPKDFIDIMKNEMKINTSFPAYDTWTKEIETVYNRLRKHGYQIKTRGYIYKYVEKLSKHKTMSRAENRTI